MTLRKQYRTIELEMPMAETFKLLDSKIVEIRPYYFDALKMVRVFQQREENASEALVLLAPIVTIIFCMQLFLDPTGLPIGSLIGVLELALAWFYRDYFKSVLVRKAAIAQPIIFPEIGT